jgi:tetratricopeptide (TPR) repeat protein
MNKWCGIFFMTVGISPIIATPDAYHLNVIAHYQLMEEKLVEAFATNQQLIKISHCPYAYGSLIRFLFATGQYPALVTLIPMIEQFFDHDIATQIIFATALEQAGNNKTADARFIALQKQQKNNPDLAYHAALAHRRNNNHHQALVILDDYLNAVPGQPRNCLFYFLKSQLYRELNNHKQALANVKETLALCPKFDKGWLLLGLLQEQVGNVNQAVHGYKTFLALTGPNSEVEQQINRLLLYASLKQTMIGEQQSSIHLVNAITWYKNKHYTRALTAVNHYLTQQPHNQEARLLKIQILSATAKLEAATELITQWIAQDPTHEFWYIILHALYRAGLDYQTVITCYQTVEQQFPDQPLPLLYLADLCTKAHDFTTALTYHDKALALITSPAMRAKLLLNKAIIYYHQHNIHAAQKVLKQGVELSSAPLLDFLAYCTAHDLHNIPYAQACVEHAITLDEKNPHLLTTQAFIWYKQGALQKALGLLKKIIVQLPEDYYVNKHLAKVYTKVGKPNLASKMYNQALRFAKTEDEKIACQRQLQKLRH